MNNSTYDILKKHQIRAVGYSKDKKVEIINTQDGNRYVLKKGSNNYDIYQYLLSRDFNYFPTNYNYQTDNYDLTEYIEDTSLNDEQKLNDLLYILGNLHHKTSFQKELDLDEIKEVYENINDKVISLLDYYSKLNDYIDMKVMLSPSEYLLIRNISLIYYMLNFSSKQLKLWYQNVQKEHTIRHSLVHHNIDLSHFLVNHNYYLVSWDRSRFDIPTMDLIELYQKYYNEMDLKSVLNSYQSGNKLNKMELVFFMINLSLPKKILLTSNTYNDTKSINQMIIYLKKVYEFVKDISLNEPSNHVTGKN